jgi:putative glutamine amidotransferase
LGGTLQQDLPEITPGIVHRGNPDKTHEVELEQGSLLYDITKEQQGLVNTAHHQGVGELGKGLKVTSRAPDGVVEGIEWENPAGKGFLLGVQWHPERMFSFGLQYTALSASILERFLKESRITTLTR